MRISRILAVLAQLSCPCRALNSQSSLQHLVVVGGGAAGIFGAISACEHAAASGQTLKATVFEQGSKPLSKVLISGGGRCNVMHDSTKPPEFIAANYPRGRRELLGPISAKFGAVEAAAWFESRGVALKTEADGRMFPTTDDSSTIADCLLAAAAKAGVKVITQSRVTKVQLSENESGLTFEVCVSQRGKPSEGEGSVYEADCVLLCPGASKEGWAWAEALGHRIETPVPSLFTLNLAESRSNPKHAPSESDADESSWMAGLAGVSVPHVSLSLMEEPKVSPEPLEVPAEAVKPKKKKKKQKKPKALVTESGPVLLTHTGISGPAALRLSAFSARLLADSKYKGTLEIDWSGGMKTADVQKALESVQRTRLDLKGKFVVTFCPLPREAPQGGIVPGAGNAVFKGQHTGENGTPALLPRRLWAALVTGAAGIRGDRKWSDLTPAELMRLSSAVATCRLNLIGKGSFKDEFVTCGGVNFKDVDTNFMESKVTPGLFFAGEVLNVDGVTGGFNFQSAWTTGFLAGRGIAARARGGGS